MANQRRAAALAPQANHRRMRCVFTTLAVIGLTAAGLTSLAPAPAKAQSLNDVGRALSDQFLNRNNNP